MRVPAAKSSGDWVQPCSMTTSGTGRPAVAARDVELVVAAAGLVGEGGGEEPGAVRQRVGCHGRPRGRHVLTQAVEEVAHRLGQGWLGRPAVPPTGRPLAAVPSAWPAREDGRGSVTSTVSAVASMTRDAPSADGVPPVPDVAAGGAAPPSTPCRRAMPR
jgi:hypothetical protein